MPVTLTRLGHRADHVVADRLSQTQPPLRTLSLRLPGLSRAGSRTVLRQTSQPTRRTGHGLGPSWAARCTASPRRALDAQRLDHRPRRIERIERIVGEEPLDVATVHIWSAKTSWWCVERRRASIPCPLPVRGASTRPTPKVIRGWARTDHRLQDGRRTCRRCLCVAPPVSERSSAELPRQADRLC